MRKRTVRNGLRLVIACLGLVVLASFYHEGVADLFRLSPDGEFRMYRLAIFWASAIGGYGVVLITLGLVMSPGSGDQQVRLLPLVALIALLLALFAYLTVQHVSHPERYDRERLAPGESITI